jgi:hypothetical protein
MNDDEDDFDWESWHGMLIDFFARSVWITFAIHVVATILRRTHSFAMGLFELAVMSACSVVIIAFSEGLLVPPEFRTMMRVVCRVGVLAAWLGCAYGPPLYHYPSSASPELKVFYSP